MRVRGRTAAKWPLAFPLALGLATLAVPAASAAEPFDGAWSVVASTETGSCAGPHRYPIAIRNGELRDAGTHDGVQASGRADRDGRVSGTIRTGLARIAVNGRLRGSTGTGQWALGGLKSCTGRWTAKRTG